MRDTGDSQFCSRYGSRPRLPFWFGLFGHDVPTLFRRSIYRSEVPAAELISSRKDPLPATASTWRMLAVRSETDNYCNQSVDVSALTRTAHVRELRRCRRRGRSVIAYLGGGATSAVDAGGAKRYGGTNDFPSAPRGLRPSDENG